MRYFLSFVLLFFLFGCDEKKDEAIKLSPNQEEAPSDVPIAKSEPQSEVYKDLPPLPVTE